MAKIIVNKDDNVKYYILAKIDTKKIVSPEKLHFLINDNGIMRAYYHIEYFIGYWVKV